MKKTFILSLIIFVFASACTTEEPAEQTEPATTTDETAADTLLDDQILKSAARANDLEGCDEILNEAKKTECTQIVNANLLTIQAVNEEDKSICGDIELERYVETCESSVEEVLESHRAELEADKLAQEAFEIGMSAMESGNTNLCDQIEYELERASCKYNVITNKAIEANDASLCEAIGQDDFIQACKDNVPTGHPDPDIQL